MIRRSVAGLVLGISLLAGSLAWSGFIATRTVFDPDRSRDVAEELLDNDQVRAQLVDNISGAVNGLIPEGVEVDPALVESAAEQTLNDPQVEQLLLSAFADTHAAFLGQGDAPTELDVSVIGERARAALIQAAPQLETAVPAAPTLAVPLPTERIPDASPVRSFLEKVVPVLGAAALLGVVFALFATTDRPGILRRAGTWALGTTAFYLAIGLGLPWLLRNVAPDQTEVFAALATALLRTTLAPSIVLGIVGVGLVATSMLWPSGLGRRSEREPRAPREVRATPRRARASARPGRQAGPAPAGPSAYPAGYPTPPASPYPTPHQSGPPTATQPRVAPARQPSPPRPAPPPQPAAPVDPRVSNSVFAPDPASAPRPDAGPPPPTWVEGHGWVLHPDDRRRPANGRHVEGVGFVVPGPPPS